REDNPLTRITRTVLYIYTKNCIQEGDRNSCNPLLMELSAPSNFYTREIKKMRCAGGLFHHWWETWHHINQLDNG
ncbi:hypothetical protein OM291_25470, partial [Escherichia albertii]|nr:hypothetical protein [Escherichia albertii]